MTATPSDIARQNMRLKTFEANHSANLGFSAKGWTFLHQRLDLTLKLQILLPTCQILEAIPSTNPNIPNPKPESYSNDLKYTTATPYGSLGVNYKK